MKNLISAVLIALWALWCLACYVCKLLRLGKSAQAIEDLFGEIHD